MKRPRILLADEHRLLLEGIEKLLGSEFEVVEMVADGRELVAAASRLKPDVIVSAVSLPLLNGVDAAVQIRRRFPHANIIFLSGYADRDQVSEGLRAGASGYLVKHCRSAELITAIREVLHGRSYVTPLVTNVLLSTFREALGTNERTELTSRQREILQLIAEGYSLKEISGMLNVSRKTVEYHKYGMMQKLGVRSNAELIQYAVERGFLQPRVPPGRGRPRKHE